MSSLAISLLGYPHFFLDGEKIENFNTRKDAALLAYLATTGTLHSREHLAALLWSDLPENRARQNLRHALSHLHKAIGPTWIETQHGIQLTRKQPWTVDVQTLRTAIDTLLPQVDNNQIDNNQIDNNQIDNNQIDNNQIDNNREKSSSTGAEQIFENISRSIALYQGEFLQGFHIRKAALFEEWVLAERELYQAMMVRGFEKLARYRLARGEIEQGLAATRRYLQLAPWSETAHQLQMRLLAHSGQRAAALTQYSTCQRILLDDLGVEPLPETTALYKQIQRGRYGLTSTTNPSTESRIATSVEQKQVHGKVQEAKREEPQSGRDANLTQPVRSVEIPHNLPAALVSRVGYKNEIGYIQQQLANPSCRLLTLVGTGGAGKTHLALAAGRQLIAGAAGRAQFTDGVYFVALDGVREERSREDAEAAIALAIATVLEFRLDGVNSPQQQLQSYLSAKKMLLILDNLEHLIEGSPLLTFLLGRADGLFILSTSRSGLRLKGEHVLEVPGLLLAPQSARHTTEYDDATQLFIDRARSADHRFQVNEETLVHIRRICHLVDGLPLGIELAAGWLPIFDCHSLAERLAESMDFLVSVQRDSLARHHSLRAIFDTSWNLLSPAQRVLLAQLSVFQPNFSLAAAINVVEGATSDLMTLVNHSLLQRTDNARLSMHRSIRQFAHEKLEQESTQRQAIEKAYARYYLQRLTHRAEEINRPAWHTIIAELLEDVDNIKSALNHTVRYHLWLEFAESINTVFTLHEQQGWLTEGVTLFRSAADQIGKELATDQTDHAPRLTALRGQLLASQGWFQSRLGHLVAASDSYQQSISVLRPLLALMQSSPAPSPTPVDSAEAELLTNVRNELGSVLRNFALLHLFIGKPEPALRLLEEARPLVQRPANKVLLLTKTSEAWYRMGQYELARPHAEESIRLARQIENLWVLSFAIVAMGRLEVAQGNYTAAATYIQEGYELHVQLRDQSGTAQTLHDMAHIMRLQGNFERALSYIQQGMELTHAHGLDIMHRDLLWERGSLALAQGDYVEAKHFFMESRRGEELYAINLGLPVLGWAYMGLGQLAEAEAYYKAFICAALPYKAYRHLAEALSGLVVLLSLANQLVEPERTIARLQEHPATTRETKERLQTMVARLNADSPINKTNYAPSPEMVTLLQDSLQIFTASAHAVHPG